MNPAAGTRGTDARSRAAKIWSRTRVGGTLTLAVGLLVYLSSVPGGALATLVITWLTALWVALEAHRMGVFGDATDARLLAAAMVSLTAGALWMFAVLDPSSESEVKLWLDGNQHWLATGGAVVVILLCGTIALLPDLRSSGRRLSVLRYLGSLLWIGLPLTGLYILLQETGTRGLASILILSKIGDIAGYYTGSLLGVRFPHHPFPRLSPGKTAVGCWGSLAAGVLTGYVLMVFGWLPEARFGVLSALAAGAWVNVASQAGDLLESAAKRRAGVKDSGSRFGPSGGVLDLVDSLLLSVPAALLAWPLLFEGPWSN